MSARMVPEPKPKLKPKPNLKVKQEDDILMFLLTKCLESDVGYANSIKNHVKSKLDKSGSDRKKFFNSSGCNDVGDARLKKKGSRKLELFLSLNFLSQ